MKNYIVRSPEHDRKMVTVPEAAGDLGKTNYGIGDSTGTLSAETGQESTATTTATDDAYGVVASNGGLTVERGGLYLAILLVVWNWQTSPSAVARTLKFYDQDDTLLGVMIKYDTVYDLHMDQFTYLVRVADGGTVKATVEQSGGGGSTTFVAILQIVQVAP